MNPPQLERPDHRLGVEVAEPPMLSPKEVAAACGFNSARPIYKAIERGELPATRLCGRLRVEASDVEAWKAANRVMAQAVPPVAPSRPRSEGRLRRLLDSMDGEA